MENFNRIRRMCQSCTKANGPNELATKEKLGGESDGALTQLLKLMNCRNITEEQ